METFTNKQLLYEYYRNINDLHRAWEGYTNISAASWKKKVDAIRKEILRRMDKK
jgi:hypothetical protein